MRCPDGREPLDFAVDASVRQLLLAEVEALRMGLLDELLAEEDGAKSKKSKKAKKKEKQKGEAAAAEAEAAATGGGAEGGAGPSGAPSAEPAAADAATPSKSKKKKKGKGSANSANIAEMADEAAAPEKGGDASANCGPTSPTRAKTGSTTTSPAATPPGASTTAGTAPSGRQGIKPASLIDAAVAILSSHTPPSLRISALISALYEKSAGYKEEVRHAGGAQKWLAEHAEAFELSKDDTVRLRKPAHQIAISPPSPASPAPLPAGLPPPRTPVSSRTAGGVKLSSHGLGGDSDSDGDSAHNSPSRPKIRRGASEGTPSPAAPNTAPPGSANFGAGSANYGLNSPSGLPMARSLSCEAFGADDGDHAVPPPPRRLAHLPPRHFYCATVTPTRIYCAGLTGEISPLQIEKKIRAVQKKLRRVQMIDDQAMMTP